jgi:hypothetical protein
MASTLNLDEYTPNIAAEMTGEQLAKAKQVKMLGIVALILLVCSLIPILGFFTLIAAFIISRVALRISRKNLVPIEYEKPAYWASVISLLLMILAVIGIVLIIM